MDLGFSLVYRGAVDKLVESQYLDTYFLERYHELTRKISLSTSLLMNSFRDYHNVVQVCATDVTCPSVLAGEKLLLAKNERRF